MRFRHRLERHQLTEAIFQTVKDLLTERRLLLRGGMILDATIIAAPTSTKNATRTRDPEMKSTCKGTTWYFGMKLHTGTDRRGRVPSVTATDAATHDITQMPYLLHDEELEIYGDRAYWKEADRQAHRKREVRHHSDLTMSRRYPERISK